MNSLPPRYPSNAPAPSIVNLSDDMASVKLQKLKFRSSNGDFLQPPHLVIDKIVHKPKESRNTAADNEDDKDSAAYEIASLKVELAKARTEARQHARVALYLRRENRRLQSEMEAIRSNQIMFLEQKVGVEGQRLKSFYTGDCILRNGLFGLPRGRAVGGCGGPPPQNLVLLRPASAERCRAARKNRKNTPRTAQKCTKSRV